MKKQNTPLLIGIAVGLLLVFILLGVFLRRGSLPSVSQPTVTAIVLTNNGTQFSLDSSGHAVWGEGEGTKSELWSSQKTRSFFEYYYDNWAATATVSGGTAYVTTNGSDELANVITTGGGGGGGGGNGGGDISQFFATPTPVPNSGAGGDPPTGGNNGGPSWCIHWRLSYCADGPPDTSTPAPTPQPTSGPTPLPPDCNNTGNQQTGRTVISNDLCLPTPTP